MLANFFGKSKPINYVLISSLFFVVFFLVAFDILKTSNSFNSYATGTGVISLFLIIFFLLNFILLKNKLTLDNSFSFLLFVLFLSYIPDVFFSVSTIILCILNLLFLRKVYSLKSLSNVIQKLFDAGLWLGISFLLEPFSVVFALLLYAAILLFQKITIQTLLVPISGFIVPILFYFTYTFWFDSLDDFYALFYWYTFYDFSLLNEKPLIYVVGFLSFFGFIGLLLKSPRAFAVNNTFRKYWILLIINTFCAIGFFALLKEKTSSDILYIFFPLAVIITNWIEIIPKKSIKEVVLWVFILFPFLLQVL